MRFLTRNRPLLLAALSGLLLTGSFPKFGAPWVAWVALFPLFWALENLPAGRRFLTGLVAGLAHYLTLTYWLTITMQTYGGLNLAASIAVLCLLSLYLALYVGVFAWLQGWLASKPLQHLAGAPVLWVFLEFIRAHALTGFPWELLGYSQYKALPVIQIADIFGVYGISFLIVAVNAGLFLLSLFVKNRSWRGEPVAKRTVAAVISAMVLLPGATLAYGHLRMETIRREAAEATRIKAAAIQGNIHQEIKWDPAFILASTETYLRLSREAMTNGPELIVWPESATPFYFQRSTELTRLIENEIRATDAFYVIGSPALEEDGDDYRYYNSAFLMTPDGEVAGRYDKQHLVPFGEYVPLKNWLFFVDKLVAGAGEFSAGPSGMTLPWANGEIGIQICYEVIFPGLSRRAAQNRANLLIYLSNDAWYGTSSAPYQLFSMSTLRAVETRRSVIRAANTGISGFIDPTGRIMDQSGLFEAAAVTAEVPILSTETLYTRWGDWLAMGCGLVSILWITIIFINSRRHRQPA